MAARSIRRCMAARGVLAFHGTGDTRGHSIFSPALAGVAGLSQPAEHAEQRDGLR
jgi:hypothetical protein